MSPIRPRVNVALLCGALLGACASSPQPLGEWAATDYRGEPAQRVLVVAAISRITRRRAFEDTLAGQIAQTGAEALPSHQLLTARLELGRGELEAGIARHRSDAVLMLALVPVDAERTYRPPEEQGDGAFFDYHEHAFAAAARRAPRAPTVIETSLFDARSGRLLWSMQSAVMEPTQPRHFIEAHLAAAVERLRRGGLVGGIPGADPATTADP